MYSFFQFTTGIIANELVDPKAYLQMHGFACKDHKLFRIGMLKSELYRSGTGAANLARPTVQLE